MDMTENSVRTGPFVPADFRSNDIARGSFWGCPIAWRVTRDAGRLRSAPDDGSNGGVWLESLGGGWEMSVVVTGRTAGPAQKPWEEHLDAWWACPDRSIIQRSPDMTTESPEEWTRVAVIDWHIIEKIAAAEDHTGMLVARAGILGAAHFGLDDSRALAGALNDPANTVHLIDHGHGHGHDHR